MSADAVRVVVRVRPYVYAYEKQDGAECCVEVANESEQITIKHPLTGVAETFASEQSLNSFVDEKDSNHANQETVWNSVGVSILETALQGVNVTLFTYGQSGSGKSHSLFGSNDSEGLVSRLCRELFNTDSKTPAFKVECSMLEFCNEDVRDLLNDQTGLRVVDHRVKGPYIPSLSLNAVETFKELASVLDKGLATRAIGDTSPNTSRSNLVFQLVLTQTISDTNEKVSVINLVDSAAPCRGSDIAEQITEANLINQALTAFDRIVYALADNKAGADVPYKSSKLTHLLQESLGGNTKTILLATISPAAAHYNETRHTLKLAQAMNNVSNTTIVNESPIGQLSSAIQKEIEQLRANAESESKQTSTIGSSWQEDLAENELLLIESQRTWRERVDETKQRFARRDIYSGEHMNMVKESTKRMSECAHMFNLNADPLLNENVVCIFDQPSTSVGRFQPNNTNNLGIMLGSLGIENEHCRIEIRTENTDIVQNDNIVFDSTKHVLRLIPQHQARVYVNGALHIEPVKLSHLDRIVLGALSVFRVHLPGADVPNNLKNLTVNWMFAMKEMNASEVAKLGFEKKQHSRETAKYVEQVEKQVNITQEMIGRETDEKEQARLESELKGRTDEVRILKRAKVWRELCGGVLEDRIVQAMSLTHMANWVSEIMNKNIQFCVKIVNNKGNSSGSAADIVWQSQVFVEVLHQNGRQSQGAAVWEFEKFITRLHLMLNMYETWTKCNKDVDAMGYTAARDPFLEISSSSSSFSPSSSSTIANVSQHLIGRAAVYLTSLIFLLHIDMKCPVLDGDGYEKGQVHVRIRIIQLGSEAVNKYDTLPTEEQNSSSRGGRKNSYRADAGEWSAQHLDKHVGKQLVVRVEVVRALELPFPTSRNTVVKYTFGEDATPMESSTVKGKSQNPQFNSVHDFEMVVTQSLIEWLGREAIEFQVWGQEEPKEIIQPSAVLASPIEGNGSDEGVVAGNVESKADVIADAVVENKTKEEQENEEQDVAELEKKKLKQEAHDAETKTQEKEMKLDEGLEELEKKKLEDKQIVDAAVPKKENEEVVKKEEEKQPPPPKKKSGFCSIL